MVLVYCHKSIVAANIKKQKVVFHRIVKFHENLFSMLFAPDGIYILARCPFPLALLSRTITQYSDMLYSMKTSEGEGYVYCLIEHQSSAVEMMAFRLLRYSMAARGVINILGTFFTLLRVF